MKQLNKIQSALLLLGGVLMVVGACSFVLKQIYPWLVETTSWVFLLGTVLFSVIQSMQTYEGNDPTIKRLKRIQSIADIFFILSGMLMVDTVYHVLVSLFDSNMSAGYYTYIEYVYNKWVVLLLIAAILEVYTTHRLDSELKKTKNT